MDTREVKEGKQPFTRVRRREHGGAKLVHEKASTRESSLIYIGSEDHTQQHAKLLLHTNQAVSPQNTLTCKQAEVKHTSHEQRMTLALTSASA